MIEIAGIRKADSDDPPHFVLVYVDLEKKENEKGYFQTTKSGSETQLRAFLKSCEMSDAEIDRVFENAR